MLRPDLLDGPRLDIVHETLVHVASIHDMQMPSGIPAPDAPAVEAQTAYFRLAGFQGADAAQNGLEEAGLVEKGEFIDIDACILPVLEIGRNAMRDVHTRETNERIRFYRTFLLLNRAVRRGVYDPKFLTSRFDDIMREADNSYIHLVPGRASLRPYEVAHAARSSIEMVGPRILTYEAERLDQIVSNKRSKTTRWVGHQVAERLKRSP